MRVSSPLVLAFVSALSLVALQGCAGPDSVVDPAQSDPNVSADGGPGAGSLNDGASPGADAATPVAPQITVDDVTVIPGQPAKVRVLLNAAQSAAIDFTYATSNGTALAGTHYTATNGNGSLAVGAVESGFDIPTQATVDDLGKEFNVKLTFPAPFGVKDIKVRIAAVSSSPGPLKNGWLTIPDDTSVPSALAGHSAVWTGSRMIVFGGGLAEGQSYDPITNKWQAISTTGAPSTRMNHTAVWTGSKMVVFGGNSDTDGYVNDGASYDPVTDSWAPISTAGAPSARVQHTAVWADSKMIVWGGYGDDLFNDGGIYDPASNTWAPLAQTNPPEARRLHAAAWANGRMYVLGGTNYVTYLVGTSTRDDFVSYNPADGTWTTHPNTDAPSSRFSHQAASSGSKLFVWGGLSGAYTADGGAVYDIAAGTWTPMSTLEEPGTRFFHSMVWTGSSLLVMHGAINAQARDGLYLYY